MEFTADAKTARVKLRWLDGQLDACRPTLLLISEVNGSHKSWGPLRKWMRARGFAAEFLPGQSSRNGIVAAVDTKVAKLVSSRRVATRALVVINPGVQRPAAG